MRLDVREVSQEDVWQEFLISSQYNSFLQSWFWGEFWSNTVGKKVFRLGFYSDERLIAVAGCNAESTRFGQFVYVPRGPVVDWSDRDLSKSVVNSLGEYFQRKDFIFLRIDPPLQEDKYGGLYKDTAYRPAKRYLECEWPWKINTKFDSDDQLMKWLYHNGATKKLKGHIRRARKKGVTVRHSSALEDLRIFYNLHTEMSGRKSISSVSLGRLEGQLKYLGPKGYMEIFIAEHEGVPVAAAIVTISGKHAEYRYGGSLVNNNDLEAPRLLHWEIMRYCMSRGVEVYDMGGITAPSQLTPGHPGYGFSRFKMSFGGYHEQYLRTRDYPINTTKYRLFSLQEIYWVKKFRSRY